MNQPIEFPHVSATRFFSFLLVVVSILAVIAWIELRTAPAFTAGSVTEFARGYERSNKVVFIALLFIPVAAFMAIKRIKLRNTPYIIVTDDKLIIHSLFMSRCIPINLIAETEVLDRSNCLGVRLKLKHENELGIPKWQLLLLVYNYKRVETGVQIVLQEKYFIGSRYTLNAAIQERLK